MFNENFCNGENPRKLQNIIELIERVHPLSPYLMVQLRVVDKLNITRDNQPDVRKIRAALATEYNAERPIDAHMSARMNFHLGSALRWPEAQIGRFGGHRRK